jgi:hypothetical protein
MDGFFNFHNKIAKLIVLTFATLHELFQVKDIMQKKIVLTAA